MANRPPTFYYRLFGKTVSSCIALGGLPRLKAGPASITLGCASRPFFKKKPDWFHSIGEPGRRRFVSFGRISRGFIIRFHGQADFFVPSVGCGIRYLPRAHTSAEQIAAMFLAHVLPLTMNLGGKEVLHSSAVCVGGEAVVFAGKSGAGKSSLAAALVQQGHLLLTDDALIVSASGGFIYAIPSMPELRLWRSSVDQFFSDVAMTEVGPKTRVAMPQSFQSTPLRMGRLYFLNPRTSRQGVSCVRLNPGKAVPRLLEHSFRLNLLDPRRMLREISLFAKLVGSVPIYELSYPKRWDALPQLLERITADGDA